MCYNTTNAIGGITTWTNRIFYDSFQSNWKNSFMIDTWNNSQFCCSDPLVSPTYNTLDNVISSDFLTMRVSPFQGERIIAYSSSITSWRDDILYGSFRMSAKMSPVEGTSFGFFFFYSVTEEIDIEVLAHEQSKGIIRVSIQPIIRDNLNRASNLSQKIIDLDMPLSNDFLEYRFDWFKSRVDFFIDSRYYHSLNVNIPSHHGKIVINHRSNGNPKWSRGPPETSSDVQIRSVDLYFNSSESNECRSLNYGERTTNFQNEELKKYIAPLIVGCLIFVIISVAVIVNVYRKLHPQRPNAVLRRSIDGEIRISQRRP